MYDGFDWDDANRDHIAEHGVSTVEAEEASSGESLFLDAYVVDNELRVESVGSTRSGRILKLVTTDRDERIRILTAFDAPRSLRQNFLRWMVKTMNERIIPRFASEKEEADWWYANREKHAEEFIQAAAEGRVQRGNLREHFAALRSGTTISLDAETAREALELAERRGTGIPNVLKVLVHEALQREKQLAG